MADTATVKTPQATPGTTPTTTPTVAAPGPDPFSVFADIDALAAEDTPSTSTTPRTSAGKAQETALKSTTDAREKERAAKSKSTPTPSAKDTKPATVEEKPTTPADDSTPGDKPPTDTKPAEPQDPSQEFKDLPPLRRAFNARVAENRELKARLQTLEAERKPAHEPPEFKQVKEKLSTVEKRLEEAENELRYANYLKSTDYKQKFESPFQDALAEAYESTKEITVEQEDGTTRQATTADFDRLITLPLGEAIKYSKAVFGDASTVFLGYRTKLKDLQQQAAKAVQQHRAEAGDREKRKMEEDQRQREVLTQRWTALNDSLVTKYKSFFGETEGDEEGNKLLKQGWSLIQKAFEGNGETSVEDRLEAHALVRQRAAAFSREVWRRKQAEKERDEWKTRYEETQDSTPTTGEGDGKPPATDAAESFEQMVDEAVRKGV